MLRKHSKDIQEYYKMLNVTERCEKETRIILDSKKKVYQKEMQEGNENRGKK